MKSYRNLVKTALSDESMNAALDRAAKGKERRWEVQDVLYHREEVKARVRKWIVTKEYPEIPHRAIIRRSGANMKERVITPPVFTARFPEQWMHHILIRAIEPMLMKGIYFHAHAAVVGKGVHSAAKAIKKFIRREKKKSRYFLKLDIRKFYPSIPVERLKEKVRRRLKDPYLLALAEWVLDANEITLPDGTKEKKGLLIGFYTSQYFANYYLQDFDHYVTEKLHPGFYARYMDDLILFDSNKRRLKRIGGEVVRKLEEEGLSLKNPPQVREFSKTPLNLIGLKFERDRTGIRKPIYLRVMRLARRMGRRLPHLSPHHAASFISYLGWFKITDTAQAWVKWIQGRVNVKRCKRAIGIAARRVAHLR